MRQLLIVSLSLGIVACDSDLPVNNNSGLYSSFYVGQTVYYQPSGSACDSIKHAGSLPLRITAIPSPETITVVLHGTSEQYTVPKYCVSTQRY